MPARSAFTLFELLVVLALICLFASIGLPAINTWRKRIEIDRAQSALIGTVGAAKRRAVHGGESCRIQSEVNPSCLTISPVQEEPARSLGRRANAIDVHNLPSSIRIEIYKTKEKKEKTLLYVSSQGILSPAIIFMEHDGKLVNTYEIERLTGEMRRLK